MILRWWCPDTFTWSSDKMGSCNDFTQYTICESLPKSIIVFWYFVSRIVIFKQHLIMFKAKLKVSLWQKVKGNKKKLTNSILYFFPRKIGHNCYLDDNRKKSMLFSKFQKQHFYNLWPQISFGQRGGEKIALAANWCWQLLSRYII